MSLPPNLSARYLDRFDKLIKEGEKIIDSLEKVKVLNPDTEHYVFMGSYKPDPDSYTKWRVNCTMLLRNILTKDTIHHCFVEEFSSLESVDEENPISKDFLIEKVAKLKAIKENFEEGFLGDLSLQIEAEISADYMTQAEALLNQGGTGQYNHVPAAVLAGAVLEKCLRTLCDEQVPPISTLKENKEPKTLHPLIEDLKKAKVFNEVQAKRLQFWAAIRNKAAHGEFDEFTRSDVELMIKGVDDFLTRYMK